MLGLLLGHEEELRFSAMFSAWRHTAPVTQFVFVPILGKTKCILRRKFRKLHSGFLRIKCSSLDSFLYLDRNSEIVAPFSEGEFATQSNSAKKK